jgi:hypothetical protein
VQVLRIDDIADTPSANDREAKLELLPCSAVVQKTGTSQLTMAQAQGFSL